MRTLTCTLLAGTMDISAGLRSLPTFRATSNAARHAMPTVHGPAQLCQHLGGSRDPMGLFLLSVRAACLRYNEPARPGQVSACRVRLLPGPNASPCWKTRPRNARSCKTPVVFGASDAWHRPSSHSCSPRRAIGIVHTWLLLSSDGPAKGRVS